jgi:hypothetical protein
MPAFLALYFTLVQIRNLPYSMELLLRILQPLSPWLLLLLTLLPVAITMSLIWKIKEAILASVFGPEH